MQPGRGPAQRAGTPVHGIFCPASGRLHRGTPAGHRRPAAEGRGGRAVRPVPAGAFRLGCAGGAGGCRGAAPPGPPGPAGLCGPHHGPRLQRLQGGCAAISAAAGAPAGAFGPAGPRHRAGIRPVCHGEHRRGPAGAALCGHRISGVHPPHRALPPHQRGGRAHPVAAGAVFCGGTASAGGWALFAAPPLLCGQSGRGGPAFCRGAAHAQRGPHLHPPRAGGCRAGRLPAMGAAAEIQPEITARRCSHSGNTGVLFAEKFLRSLSSPVRSSPAGTGRTPAPWQGHRRHWRRPARPAR